MVFSKGIGSASLLILILTAGGCTHRDVPPPTPVENDATPTYRSTTNSYELNTAPRFTQSGIDGGEPATLPSIGSPARFSQNTPLAFAVFNVLHFDNSIDTRYVSVFSKGGTIELLGTVRKSDLPTLLKKVRSQPGVKSVDNKLEIK